MIEVGQASVSNTRDLLIPLALEEGLPGGPVVDVFPRRHDPPGTGRVGKEPMLPVVPHGPVERVSTWVGLSVAVLEEALPQHQGALVGVVPADLARASWVHIPAASVAEKSGASTAESTPGAEADGRHALGPSRRSPWPRSRTTSSQATSAIACDRDSDAMCTHSWLSLTFGESGSLEARESQLTRQFEPADGSESL